MEEYSSNKFNSVNTPVEDKKVTKIVDGNTKKKSRTSKLRDAFLPEDINSVGSYLITEIVIPYIKNIADDVFHTLLWGRSRSKSSSKSSYNGAPSYRDYYESKKAKPSYSSVYNFDYVELNNMGDADLVLESMRDILTRYGAVSISDMYDLVGKTGTYQDCKYGWVDLRPARIERTREGTYIIVCPRPIPLNN